MNSGLQDFIRSTGMIDNFQVLHYLMSKHKSKLENCKFCKQIGCIWKIASFEKDWLHLETNQSYLSRFNNQNCWTLKGLTLVTIRKAPHSQELAYEWFILIHMNNMRLNMYKTQSRIFITC